MLRRFTATFFAGLTALLPMIVTIALVVFIARYIYSWLRQGSLLYSVVFSTRKLLFGEAAETWTLYFIYVLSLAIAIAGIWVVGFFARRYIGKRIGGWVEAVISKIPFINKIYNSVDQVIDLFRKKDKDAAAALTNVVLMKFANMRMLGMLASNDPVLIHGVPHYLIYVPSTPIPTTGFNYFVPCEDVDDVAISVEEMTRIIVSLGSLGPPIMNAKDQLFLPAPQSHGGAQPPSEAGSAPA